MSEFIIKNNKIGSFFEKIFMFIQLENFKALSSIVEKQQHIK